LCVTARTMPAVSPSALSLRAPPHPPLLSPPTRRSSDLPDEVAELKRVGACADLLGHFFSADGAVLDTDLSARATSMSMADLRKRSEEHTSELQSRFDLVCRLLREKKKKR